MVNRRNLQWLIILLLLITNFITAVLLFTLDSRGKGTVAKIGKEKIVQKEWFAEMEKRYGKETLKGLVDEQVITQAAEKYGVNISEQELEHEILMLKSMYHSYYDDAEEERAWKEEIKLRILLEELLTKDVMISETELEEYYNQNINRFQITPAYHISHIVVESEQAAGQILKELKDKASFSVLAMESSLDEFSANNGGDIGFIEEGDERFSEQYIETVKKLEPHQWSEPIRTENGFAIVQLNEKINGKDFSFQEVNNIIRRHIALEQMDMPISTKPFWEDLKVRWYYEN